MKRMTRIRMVFITVFTAVCVIGCAKKKETGGDAAQAVSPPDTTAVSLSGQLMPVFGRSCGGCHRREGGHPGAVREHVYFETAADIMARVGRGIIPGKPDESGFVSILDQTKTVSDEHIVMPPPGSPAPRWNDAELTLFKQWIAQGAENN